MHIYNVQTSFYNQIHNFKKNTYCNNTNPQLNHNNNDYSNPFKKIPLNYTYGANIHFGDFYDPNRRFQDITHEKYIEMKEPTLKRLRVAYANFHLDPFLDKSELFKPEQARLPLQDPKTMDKFIETSSIYLKYKDQPIICLGRSPKWFLNTALWMKDGLEAYKFVAFSERWYRPDKTEGVKRMDTVAPTEKEIRAYRKYLTDIKADPKTIVEHMSETGKKTVITDYINSGKGATSFLEIMSDFADHMGILEEFSKSIEIVGIGSMKYMEDLNPFAESIPIPRVIFPTKLWPYEKNIKQTFYDMDYKVFEDILLNENVNECRSTYYPHKYWTVYRPDKFKTGIEMDLKKIKKELKYMKNQGIDEMPAFTAPMGDYRNLINFWILDNLSIRGLLKAVHKTKM